MLSVTQARRILGSACPMKDTEIEAMILQFEQIAEIALTSIESDQNRLRTCKKMKS